MLRLYVAGSTPRAAQVILNLRAICDAHLEGRYQLHVIDVYQQPERLKADQVVATPTLVKASPSPARRLIGDLSSEQRVLRGLDLA